MSVWVNSGEDNIFFLASGVAFNILLAAVPELPRRYLGVPLADHHLITQRLVRGDA